MLGLQSCVTMHTSYFWWSRLSLRQFLKHLKTLLLGSISMVKTSSYFVLKNSADREFQSLSLKTQMTWLAHSPRKSCKPVCPEPNGCLFGIFQSCPSQLWGLLSSEVPAPSPAMLVFPGCQLALWLWPEWAAHPGATNSCRPLLEDSPLFLLSLV